MRRAAELRRTRGTGRYASLRDYALVGDCHGSALVSLDGSVDWCALGRLDADPIFARLLDADRLGFLSVAPRAGFTSSRHYREGTNVLETRFATSHGDFRLVDFMPVGRAPGAAPDDFVTLAAPLWLVRVIEGVRGRPRVTVRAKPVPGFGGETRLLALGGRVHVVGAGAIDSDLDLEVSGNEATADLELAPGERHFVVVARTPPAEPPTWEQVDRLLASTEAFWREWSARCSYRGRYREPALRSALALKLLTYAPTGAIVAAPTTSLPEEIGGSRNFDYRYCWMRDAVFTVFALGSLGYEGEARRFGDFLRMTAERWPFRLQIMYGIDGARDLRERERQGLEGYRDSRPVTIGNGAYRQRQGGVLGELVEWAFFEKEVFGRFPRSTRRFVRRLARRVARGWEKPGHGAWEMPGPPRHYTFNWLMSWVALDRALRLLGPRRRWTRERERILRALLVRGTSKEGALVKAEELEEADAILLLAPFFGVPVGERAYARTVALIEEDLRRGAFLRRYDLENGDGLPGKDGAFVACGFWYANALLFLGRHDEARAQLERLIASANDVGLLSEEIDPKSEELLGNFPQGLSHLSLIQSIVDLELAESQGRAVLAASHAERARRFRALWPGPGAARGTDASVLPPSWATSPELEPRSRWSRVLEGVLGAAAAFAGAAWIARARS